MATLHSLALAAVELDVLSVLPEDEASAVPGGELNALLVDYGRPWPGNHVTRAVRILKDAEMLQRRRQPGAPEGLGRLLQYQLVWRTARGTKALAQARLAGSETVGQGGTVEREDDRLLDPRNTTRGAWAYRKALADHGLTSPHEVLAIPREKRRAFELTWSAHMRAMSAAAGFPIPERLEHRRQGSAG